jgi:hypothetical protein
VGTRKTFQKRSAGETRWGVVVEASKVRDGIEIGGPAPSPEMSLVGARVPGQAVPGVEAA